MLTDSKKIMRWLDGLGNFDGDNTRHCLAMFALLGIPRSYLDIGSGTGVFVNTARKLGVDAWGADQLPRDDKWLLQHDLCNPLELNRKFQFVSCIEVAEHLPPEAAPVLCDTIVRHVEVGGLVIFTAAPPGQGGTDHINLQQASYWRGLLTERGLTYSHYLTIWLALLWGNIHTPHGHLSANLQMFTYGSVLTPSGIRL